MKRCAAFFILALCTVVSSGCVEGVAYVRAVPPQRVEVIPAAPYPGAVWVPGHWQLRRHRREYVWVPGHWRGVAAVMVPAAPAPVVMAPAQPAVAAPAPAQTNTLTVNVPNSGGGYTPVNLVKKGDGYVGPQGEYYQGNPTVDQLKALYGK